MANKVERISMVKAMEFVVRNLNDEELIMPWLMNGVADGDVEYNGNVSLTEDDMENLEWYIDDEHFADLMHLFLRLMKAAAKSGGLFCDGVVDKEAE